MKETIFPFKQKKEKSNHHQYRKRCSHSPPPDSASNKSILSWQAKQLRLKYIQKLENKFQ